MIWPTKIQWQRQCKTHLKNTLNQWPQKLVSFDNYDQSDEETWADKQNYNYKDEDNDNDNNNDI